jgi:hypothetical protein
MRQGEQDRCHARIYHGQSTTDYGLFCLNRRLRGFLDYTDLELDLNRSPEFIPAF